MKKFVLLLLLSSFSLLSFAQIDIGIPGGVNESNKMKMQIAQKNAEYNGAIVGYAKACNVSEIEYKPIEKLLFKNFKTVGLGDSEINFLQNIFNTNVEMAKKRGLNSSKTECSLYLEEFKKSITIINSPETN